MPPLPSHHDTGPARRDRDAAADADDRRGKALRAAAVAAAVALVVLIVVLHVTGVVGGGSHG